MFPLHMLERLPQIFHFRLHLIVHFHIYRLILSFHCIHYFVWDSGGVFFFSMFIAPESHSFLNGSIIGYLCQVQG